MEIITAKNGLKVPVVKGTPLHSRIDPSKESLHFLSDQDKNKILIVVGLGFAYHLLEAQKSGQKIIVIEPDTSLISFFQKEGLENLKKITVLSGSFHEISRYLETDIPWQDMKEVVIKAHQPSLRIRPELYQPYLDFLKNWQEKKLLNLITDAAFGVLWIKNLLKNLLRPLSFPVFSNKNQSPALIIGSGSSLTETLPFIQDNQNQFILIAIPQVLKILKQYQIQPDLVVMVDSGYANRFYLEEMNVPLLTYLNSSALSIKYWKGPVYFMNSLLPFDQLLIPEFPPIPVSGSAANTVIEIASLLSSQIILTGFDFSFVHNLYHYQGNPLENELIYLSDKKYPLDQKQFQWVYPDSPSSLFSHSGKKIKTNISMMTYYKDFCQKIESKKHSHTFSVLTPETAFFPGAELYSSDQIPKKEKSLDKTRWIQVSRLKKRIEELKAIYESRDLKNEILQIHLTRYLMKKLDYQDEIKITHKKIIRILKKLS